MAQGSHVQLFGVPQLVDAAGRPLPFRTRKHLAVLVYLALEGVARPVTRDVLIELFWSDVSEQRARHSLSQALTAIRERLGPGALARGGERVRFARPLGTDLDRLSTGQAVQGDLTDPLSGLEGAAGAAFAHWVDATRERLRRMAREQLLGQLEAARSRGDVPAVHERAELLYRVDPLSDTAAHALAERALLAGDAVAAIRLLRQHLARAEDELGLNPHPDVERLLRRLEAGAVGPPTDEISPALRSARPEVFVGRAPELARLEAEWTAARRGGLRTVLVKGPAGIGKSSLVRRFATSVTARAWAVYPVSCQEMGRHIPFAATSELVLGLARDPAVSGTDPLWLAEASRVTPALRALYPGIPDAPPAPPESIRLRVAEAIVRMLEAVTEGGPTLFVVDDLQQMDPTSRDVMHVLLRRLEAQPVMFLATSRTPEYQRFMFGGDDPLAGLAWNAELALEPLAASHALELIARLGETEAEPGELERHTIVSLAQGNPYLIEMLLSEWQRDPSDSLVAAEARGDGTSAKWQPPETMRNAFARQYRGLGAEAQRLAQLLAVAGKRLSAAAIRSILGLTAPEMDRAAIETIERNIIRADGTLLYFRNELHRAFVYYATPKESRHYHHARLAQALAAADHGPDYAVLLEASHHFIKGSMGAEAVDVAIDGARLALAHGAPREAERALDELVRDASARSHLNPVVYLLLGESQVAQGKHHDALASVDQFVGDLSQPLDRALAAVIRAEALHRGQLADADVTRRAAREALALATGCNDDAVKLRALQNSAEVASHVIDLDTLREVAMAAQTIDEHTTEPAARAAARMTRGYCALVAGKYEDAIRHFEDCTDSFSRTHRDLELRRTRNGLGICYTNLGKFESAIANFNEAIEIAQRAGDAFSEGIAQNNLSTLYADMGWFDHAVGAIQTALGLNEVNPSARRTVELSTDAADLAILIGCLPEAVDFVRDASEAAKHTGLPTVMISVLIARADLYIAQREYESAWPLVEEALTLAGGRTPLTGGTYQFERLRKHYLWATKGYDAVSNPTSPSNIAGLGNRLAQRLELDAFEEWIAIQEGIASRRESVVAEIIRRGFFGTVARLIALGSCPIKLPPAQRGESSAQLVLRLFPAARQASVPNSVAVPRQVA